MAVLNVCRMNVNGQQKAVGDDVPLAPVNTLAGVKAVCPVGLGCWRTAYNGLVAVRAYRTVTGHNLTQQALGYDIRKGVEHGAIKFFVSAPDD